jgi:heme O synthase-like polyprenyltransferase
VPLLFLIKKKEIKEMFKMSKIIIAVISIIMLVCGIAVCFNGCATTIGKEETEISLVELGREPVAVRYEPPHYNAVTEYEYQWDWWNGEYKLLPVVKNEYVEEKFFVQYAITYTDGSVEYVWNDVPQAIYYEILESLAPLQMTEPTT